MAANDLDPPELDLQLFDQLLTERIGAKVNATPATLYHYTSSANFLKILSSNELWFTDYRYLNDLSEVRYGVELFKAEISAEAERQQRPTSLFLFALLTQLEQALVHTDVFVFCMCEENNLLNQWRVYGLDSVPISIEFDTDNFRKREGWTPYFFKLVPMIYALEAQNEIARAATALCVEWCQKHESQIWRTPSSLFALAREFAAICMDLCLAMKHPQFAVEKEWRLVTRWGLEHRILSGRFFRSSPAGIVPYLAVRPTGDHSVFSLPIRSITIGPCDQPEIQKRTLHDLLYQQVQAMVDVHISGLPIRRT